MCRGRVRFFCVVLLLVVVLLPTTVARVYDKEPKKKDTVEFGEKPVDVEKIEVRAKRIKYDKDSPAVRLLKELVAKRDSIDPMKHSDYVDFQRYEKVLISIDDFKDVDSSKKLSYLNDHTMVNPHSGKTILPVSLREKVYLSSRGKKMTLPYDTVVYNTSSGIDDRFSETTILAFVNEMLPEINLSDDHIYLARRKFISPLSRGAHNYYRFYLSGDTITYQGVRCVELEFFPVSKNSLSLRGTLTVDVDTLSPGSPYLRKAEISIPRTADINFVSGMHLEQTFELDSNGFLLTASDELSFDLSPLKQTDALNFIRTNIYSSFEFSDEKRGRKDVDSARLDFVLPENFVPTEEEKKVEALSQRFRKNVWWKIFEEVMMVCVDGYLQTGKTSYFDIGPIEQFLTGNVVEGTRVSFGGATSPNLSKYVFLDGLVGYGFDDEKIKYDVSLEWSFNPKKMTYKEFPMHSVRFTHSYDIHSFSDGFDRINNNNVFTWASRTDDTKLTYLELYQFRYSKEWENHMGLNFYARNYTIYETSSMSFAPEAGVLPDYSVSEFELRYRYAPGEKIYQTRRTRRNLNLYTLDMEFSHTTAVKGLFDGDYSRNLSTLSAFGYIDVQPLGFIDMYGSVGYEWNTVPYMLLPHPKTNMSYMSGSTEYFSMMMPLEYLYDQYVYLGFDYNLDGLIFSRLPWIKHLNLREIFTFRGIYGRLSDRNNPSVNTSLMSLPEGSSAIGDVPYIELGVGIDNIFSLFRIDYVWRVTYLDAPGVSQGALLFNYELKF